MDKQQKLLDLLKKQKAEKDMKSPSGLLDAFTSHIKEIKGEKGDAGRNPMHIGKNPPINPEIGDLWTKI